MPRDIVYSVQSEYISLYDNFLMLGSESRVGYWLREEEIPDTATASYLTSALSLRIYVFNTVIPFDMVIGVFCFIDLFIFNNKANSICEM